MPIARDCEFNFPPPTLARAHDQPLTLARARQKLRIFFHNVRIGFVYNAQRGLCCLRSYSLTRSLARVVIGRMFEVERFREVSYPLLTRPVSQQERRL